MFLLYINKYIKCSKYIIINTIPLFLVRILFLFPNAYNHIKKIEKSNKIISSIYISNNGISDINAPTPNIKHKFIIQEPMILPSAISLSPLNIAIIEVTNSGKDVPNANIVKPTTLSDILNIYAISVAEFTVKSPPYFRKIIPIII